MDSFIREQNIRTVEDADVLGTKIFKGAKVTVISAAGEYNGFKMRVPPSEFEALFLDHALSASVTAKSLKSKIRCIKSAFDGVYEIYINDENYKYFFEYSQNFMASIAFSISAIESWANNTIQSYVDDKNQPKEIEIEIEEKNRQKTIREFSNIIPSSRNFSLSRKLFKVIPKVLDVKEFTEHNKLRIELNKLIDQRNIIMHMQDDAEQKNKLNFTVSMYKRDDFYPVDLMIKYLNLMYKGSDALPLWIKDLTDKRRTY